MMAYGVYMVYIGAASNRMGQEDMDCVHTIRASVSMMRSIVNDALGISYITAHITTWHNISYHTVSYYIIMYLLLLLTNE